MAQIKLINLKPKVTSILSATLTKINNSQKICIDTNKVNQLETKEKVHFIKYILPASTFIFKEAPPPSTGVLEARTEA